VTTKKTPAGMTVTMSKTIWPDGTVQVKNEPITLSPMTRITFPDGRVQTKNTQPVYSQAGIEMKISQQEIKLMISEVVGGIMLSVVLTVAIVFRRRFWKWKTFK